MVLAHTYCSKYIPQSFLASSTTTVVFYFATYAQSTQKVLFFYDTTAVGFFSCRAFIYFLFVFIVHVLPVFVFHDTKG